MPASELPPLFSSTSCLSRLNPDRHSKASNAARLGRLASAHGHDGRRAPPLHGRVRRPQGRLPARPCPLASALSRVRLPVGGGLHGQRGEVDLRAASCLHDRCGRGELRAQQPPAAAPSMVGMAGPSNSARFCCERCGTG
jgi:hypothetical protein